jgi:hypothetical protein
MNVPEFIELDRRFRDASETEENAEIRAFLSYASGGDGTNLNPGWPEVLQSRLIVILGEAGSGKTWEMRAQAEILKEQSKIAFFIRLDRLITFRLEDVISPDDKKQYGAWLNNNQDAYFFLDSVDEAKFQNHQDFEIAIENFIRSIGTENIPRIRAVISSRISNWQKVADLAMLRRFFYTLTDSNQSGENVNINETDDEYFQTTVPEDNSTEKKT